MLWCELHNSSGVKGGITNFDPAEYEKDLSWLQVVNQVAFTHNLKKPYVYYKACLPRDSYLAKLWVQAACDSFSTYADSVQKCPSRCAICSCLLLIANSVAACQRLFLVAG